MKKIGLKYVGKAFLPGVPARDLSEAEVKKFGREDLLASGLYVEVEKKTSAKKEDKE